MHFLNARKVKVELVKLPTTVMSDEVSRSVSVAVTNPELAPPRLPGLVNRAAHAHFELGLRAGVAAAPPPVDGPPPGCFREAASGLSQVVYRELVVRFTKRSSKAARHKLLDKYGLVIRRHNPYVRSQVIVYHPTRKYEPEALIEVANELTLTDEVVVAAPNFVSQFSRQAIPPIRTEEWHLHNKGTGGALKNEDVKIKDAWAITQGTPSIIVAVLDDGVDIEHPNLKSRIWKNPDSSAADRNGRDFFLAPDHPDHFNPRPKLFRSPFDQMEGNDIHGTPCAGVIAAAGKNSGSHGAAPKCTILPVKVFHADDLAPAEHVANAIRYAAGIAHVLSCSWSGPVSPDIELALEDVAAARNGQGVPVFVAAGNGFGRPVAFPARDPNAIAVAASTDAAARANYSNVGPELAMCAPSSGGIRGIFTTDVSLPNRGFNTGTAAAGGANGQHTNSFGGTSSATPLVAGVAALMLSANSALTAVEVRNVLTSTADKIGTGYDANGHSVEFGFGRINAGKAVAAAIA